MKFEAAAYSNRGLFKETNQDSVGVDIARTSSGDVALIVVADGMGGLESGELASATVVREMSTWFAEKLPLVLQTVKDSVEGFEQAVAGQWSGMVQDLNLKIMAYGAKRQMTMGTTVTAMLAIGGRFSVLHVGDSRLYEITDTGVSQLTKDQTYVRREIEAGRMTPEEAKVHPKRNVLLQCVGASKEVVPEISHHTLNKDATYLLCSDGYRHVLSDDDFVELFAPSSIRGQQSGADESFVEATERRLAKVGEMVMERQEQDNLSAAVLHVMAGERG